MDQSELAKIIIDTIKKFAKETFESSGLGYKGAVTAFIMLSADYLGLALSGIEKERWNKVIEVVIHNSIVFADSDEGEK